MSNSRKVSESTKKIVAGRQFYKCANEPGSNLDKLAHYQCPLWARANIKTMGNFDESGYDIDHIEEFAVSNNNNISNLQALCKNCHAVKTKIFMRTMVRGKKVNHIQDDAISIDDQSDSDVEDKIDTNVKNKNYICDKCSGKFTQKAHLEYHIKNDVCSGKSFKCHFCGKGFTTDTSKYRHIRNTCKVKKERDREMNDMYEKLSKLEEENK